MAGFQSETETGVRHAFSGIAEAVGVAFGAAEVFHFGKSVVEDASNLQHQIQGIREEFGQASASVIAFGNVAAAKLGISAETADTTANRFGLLFRQLGIGPRVASAMTINLEKLGGSLAAIRGINPADVLANLPLALTGNVRVLKSLGLSIDTTQIKLAAFKAGLISNVKDPLTAAQKAEAVYLLATAKLGPLQEQAAKHAGSFANVQARLSAEWANAKAQLGGALLPVFTKYATELERWLSRMQKSGRLQHDFNEIAKVTVSVVKVVASTISTGWKIFQTAAGWVGGVRHAIILLFAVMAVNKMREIAGNIITTLVNNGLRKVGAESGALRTQWIADNGVMKAATIGLGVTMKSALIETGIGAIVVAIGFLVTYILTHWDQVKRYTVALAEGIAATWSALKTTLIGIVKVIGGAILTNLTLPLRVFLEAANKVTGWLSFLPGVSGLHNALGKGLSFLKEATTGLVSSGVSETVSGASGIASAFGKAWSKAMQKGSKDVKADPATKKALHDMGNNLGTTVSNGIAQAVAGTPAKIAKVMQDGMQQAIQSANQAIVNSVVSAEKNLDSIGAKLSDTISKILDKLGLLDPRLAGSPQALAFKKLRDLVAAGAPAFKIERARAELSSDLKGVGKTPLQSAKDRIKAQITDLTTEFNRGQISLAAFNERTAAILKRNGITYKSVGRVLGKAFADGFEENLKAVREQAAAIAAVPGKFRREANRATGDTGIFKIIRPLEVIRIQNERLALRAERQRERIAKAGERAAKAAEKTAANTAKLNAQLGSVHIGTLPGTRSKEAGVAARAGAKP